MCVFRGWALPVCVNEAVKDLNRGLMWFELYFGYIIMTVYRMETV